MIGSAILFYKSLTEYDFDWSVIYLGIHMVFLIAAYVSYTRFKKD